MTAPAGAPDLVAQDDDDPICMFTVGDVGLCAAPAEFAATAGCVHEHVGTREICADHAAVIRSGDRAVVCGYCRRGPDPHRCELTTHEVRPIR